MKILIILVIFFTGISILFGQVKTTDQDGIVFSGIVFDSDKLINPLSDVSVIIKNKNGTSTNKDGEFSLIVASNDTLKFSHIGYHPITIYIPNSVKDGKLIAKLFLLSDTVDLKQVYVSSLRDYEEFKNRFINMDVEVDKELVSAQNNINLSIYEAQTSTESTLEDRLQTELQREANKSIYYGQLPPDQVIDFVGVTAGLIYMLSTKGEKDENFYQRYIDAQNQNSLITISSSSPK